MAALDPVQPVAPLNYAVLVPSGFSEQTGGSGWDVLYANGDVNTAIQKAKEWAGENAGKVPVVVQYYDHFWAEMTVRSAKA